MVVAAGRHEVEDALTSRRLYSRLQALPAIFRWESESGVFFRVGPKMFGAKSVGFCRLLKHFQLKSSFG